MRIPCKVFCGTDDKTCMIISGSHLNYGFMQQLQAQKNQGANLGSAASLLQDSVGMRLGKGLNVSKAETELPDVAPQEVHAQQGRLPEKAPETLGQTVANEIVRRMDVATDENGQPKDVSGLRHSIGSTVDWIRDRFGDETAAAASGMILGSSGSKVTEDSLGDGFLNALKFIDRNHGYAAGDETISRFNNGVNAELNSYFDNGKSELFHVAAAPSVDQPSATQDISMRLFTRATQPTENSKDTKSASQELLDSLKKELDQTAELQNLASQLEAEFNPQANASNAMAAYQAHGTTPDPQFTNLSV